mgnify:CR=1 FL=1
MPNSPVTTYGGQAVIEGVMIRGKKFYSLAVRRPDGTISTTVEPISSYFIGSLRRVPFVRGILVLAETLTIGVKALHKSSLLAMETDEIADDTISNLTLIGTIIISLAIGIGIFFILPAVALESAESFIPSDLISNILEGVLRLIVLVAYVSIIGLFPDIQRVYQYHGAEHMSIHALEKGKTLTPEIVRTFPTPHPRCGTAFLLTVMVVSILMFAAIGDSGFISRIISRIVLIPVIASISYEIIRYAGTHPNSIISSAVSVPGLLLQKITTKVPDDSQIEVAISAVEAVLEADSNS